MRDGSRDTIGWAGAQQRWQFGVVLLALAVASAGCGGLASAADARATASPTAIALAYDRGHYPPASAITSATTLRTSDFPSNHVAAFSATATNLTALQRFYAAMIALKPMPSGVYNCPADFGVAYETAFYSRGKLVLHAVIQQGGCGLVVLGAESALVFSIRGAHFDTRWELMDAHFWP